MKNKIAIIIPAYNEVSTIQGVISSFHAELQDAEIYVIDNNSSDGTHLKAQETFQSLGINGQVLFERKQGKANAIKKAFSEINADYYVIVDADMTYLAEDVHELLRAVVDKGTDMAVGDRHAHGQYKEQNKRQFHNFGNHLIKWLIRFLFQGKGVRG